MSKSARTGRKGGSGGSWLPVRRRTPRKEKSTVLIVGDGEETEYNYFFCLSRTKRVQDRFAPKVPRGPGHSTVAVIEKATRERQKAQSRGEPFDEIWCLLDVETPDHRSEVQKALELAAGKHAEVCLSNPCFEIWIRAHFLRSSRQFKDCGAVIVDLSRRWTRRFGANAPYDKTDQDIFRRLEPLIAQAVSNARHVLENDHAGKPRCDCNSSTEVYRLVAKLTGQE